MENRGILQRKSILLLYLLVFAAFTNLTTFTCQNLYIPLMPVLFFIVVIMIMFGFLTKRPFLLVNSLDQRTWVISSFFLVFMVLGLVNANFSRAVSDEIYPLLTGFIIFYLILLYNQKEKEFEGILLTILLSGPALTLQGGYQFVQEITTGTNHYIRASGWWTDSNAYAFVLVLTYLVSFYFLDHKQKLLRIAGYWAQLSVAIGVFISLSRGGILIFLLASMLNWRAFWQRKLYLTGLILSAIILYLLIIVNPFHVEALKDFPLRRLFPSGEGLDGFSNGRLTTAITGFLIYAQHPLVGVGFGNILDYAEAISHVRLYTHNLFVEILAISGPLPFLAFLFMLVYLLLTLPKSVGATSNAGRVLWQFIIVLATMGLFTHYLLYMKPVWIFLALFPSYYQLGR